MMNQTTGNVSHRGLATVTPPTRSIPAWMMSIVFHTTLLIVLLLSIRTGPRGVEVDPDRTTGIVLARRGAEHVEYYDSESDIESKFTADRDIHEPPLPTEKLFNKPLADELPPRDVWGHPNDLTGSSMPDVAQFTRTRPPSKRFGKSVQTSVFGVTGRGTKFVYLFDRSASMGEFNARPLAAAKTELIASLEELDDVHQFQIIFYNNHPHVFNPTRDTPRMWWADDRGKTLAQRHIRTITAAGGTEHVAALEMALRLQPDVIFFLTDANQPRLRAPELARIRRLNSSTSAIHAIEFGYGPSSGRVNFLHRIARENSGQHMYIDISIFGQRQG